MGRARADAQRARSRGRARAFGRDPVLLERRRERRRAPVTLAELQRYFAAVATSTSGPPSDIDDVFQSSARLSASARLAIYNRGYHHRLLDALASVFTRTKRALGDAEFERLGLSYLAQHPSEHPAVERVG